MTKIPNTLERILGYFFCRLRNHYLINYNTNNKQLFNLIIEYKNCYKIKINDKVVPKRKNYLIGLYKNTTKIKLELFGLFNKRELFIDVNPKTLKTSLPKIRNDIDTNLKANFRIIDFDHKSIRNLKSDFYYLNKSILFKTTNSGNLEFSNDKEIFLINNYYDLSLIEKQNYEQINLPTA